MPLRKVPPLGQLVKEFEFIRWGGRFDISTSYYTQKYGMRVKWASSWDSSLKDALLKANTNEYWITLIYRSKDSVKSGATEKEKIRFLGYIDQKGELHLFKYFLPIEKAIETAFKELGLLPDNEKI